MKKSLSQALVFCFFLLSCLQKPASSAGDPIVGKWILGTETNSCMVVPDANAFYFKEEQTIKKGTSYYSYKKKYEIFGDKTCTQLLLEQTAEGTYSLGDLIETSRKDWEVHQMTHVEGNIKITMRDLAIVNRANLLTSEGLQSGDRLCKLAKDWVIYQVVDVTGRQCALGILTKLLDGDGALNILGLSPNSKKMVIGEDVVGKFAKYPLELIEPNAKEWYKKSI